MNPQLPEYVDTLFTDCRIAPMHGGNLNFIEHAALAIAGKTICWLGEEKHLPEVLSAKARNTIPCENKWILPGFVDCHTHLVWAGSRSNEFEMRLQGKTYEEIAKKGGGIMSTVHATRNASKKELYELSASRVDHFIKQGITTIEIKSGYGLNLETELKILEVIGLLGKNFPLHVEPTFLGAHALPPEFINNSDGYIDLVADTMLTKIKDQGIATAVDVFCEHIAFSRNQTQKVFEQAKKLGFSLKLHAEQLSNSDGAALAAGFNALSCDHLEFLSVAGAKSMANRGVVAVLLPGAFYYLKQTQKPPIGLLRQLNIPMAVSTDLNPGSSPIHSMISILNMACLMFGFTCEEALLGATINGARALGLGQAKGSLHPGKDADLVLWDIDTPIDLCYLTGQTPIELIMTQGKIYENSIIEYLPANQPL